MAYSDQKHYTRVPFTALLAGSFGTATAGSTTGANKTGVANLPNFPRRTVINKVTLLVTTAPNAAATALAAQFLNGTNTFATVTLTTATASGVLFATVTASNATFTASAAAPTVNVTGTATASADLLGSYDVIFETQELFS